MSVTLFIDELGTCNPKDKFSNFYVLSGSSIIDKKHDLLTSLADDIKMKYWKTKNVIFHSREIGKNQGKFVLFKNKPELKNEFLNDLLRFVNNPNIILFNIIIDKSKARKNGWNEIKIIEESVYNLFLNFLALILTSNTNGKIIVESANSLKDKYYLDNFAYFLSPGFLELNVNYKVMQEKLTSLSFVTKRNNDVEEQIVDIFAYGAKCKYLQDCLGKNFLKESYEAKLIKILEKRTFKVPENASEFKMKFYKQINPFLILPKE